MDRYKYLVIYSTLQQFFSFGFWCPSSVLWWKQQVAEVGFSTMTDRSFGLFEPDALLPAQFYSAFRGGSGVRGEKRLMLAVLEDALDCFQKYASARDGHG